MATTCMNARNYYENNYRSEGIRVAIVYKAW